MRQREMRGAVRDRKRRRRDVIHSVRNRHDRAAVERDLLGIAAAEAQHRHRALPDPQMRHFRAGLDDLAGRFKAGGEREFRLHLVLAGDHQRVGEVDAGGVHPQPRLARGRRAPRRLLDPQDLRPAPFPAQNRFHADLHVRKGNMHQLASLTAKRGAASTRGPSSGARIMRPLVRQLKPPAAILGLTLLAACPAVAQKQGGVLHMYHRDSPASMSIHEEATFSTLIPVMGVMNNLVMYDQNKAQNSLETILPDLAESWQWSEGGKSLSFKLRSDVKWHDGKPFTAADVKCTLDLLLGKGSAKLRLNPRGGWYHNVEEVTVKGDNEATFRLKERQPALLALLASGYTPIYPCHVPSADMRRKPIGTGPFKLAEFKMNEGIKLVKTPDYWKPGRPYLDGIEYTIIADRSTRMLSFASGKFDMTFPTDLTVPLYKNMRRDAPHVKCTMRDSGVSTNLIVNRDMPPFDNPKIRRALALTLDRQAFIDIL